MLANKPYVIGLTGGIGCGKTEAARYLEGLGATHLDADAISRRLTADNGEALDGIRRVFGDGVFREDGSLDRQRLGKLVFADDKARRALESIMHPLVQRDMLAAMDEAAGAGAGVVVLDVPLLFETGMDALCDETWALYAPREKQIARIVARDGLSPEDAVARIDSQMPMETRNGKATFAINTDRPIERTQAELEQLYRAAQKRAEKN